MNDGEKKSLIHGQYYSFGVFPGRKVLFLCLLFLIVITFIYIIHNIYENHERSDCVFLREDGIIEFSTAGFFFISSVLMILICKNTSITRSSQRFKIFTILFAISFFIIAMEEISWGQRLFGWGTEGWFKSHNYQNETNIHNVGNAQINEFTFVYYYLSFVFGVIFPFLFQINHRFRNLVIKLDFPIISKDLSPFFLCAFMFMRPLHDTSFHGEFNRNPWDVSLFICAIFFLLIINLSKSNRITFKQLPFELERLLPFLLLMVFILGLMIGNYHLFRRPYEMREFTLGFAFLIFSITEFVKTHRNLPC